ncbi:MAG: IS630 family transposase [Actinomycetota bacterium]
MPRVEVAVFSVEPIVLTGEERAGLERRARAHTSTVRESRRARIVLLCADGVALRQIAMRVGMDPHQVGVWRRRFLTGRLDGLDDLPRPGRPRRLGHDERMGIAAVATSERDPADPVATWSYLDVAEELSRRGVEVSMSQVWRILKAMDIDLTKVRGWLNRRDDPCFWDRVRDICGLYLNPPQRALVLSVDEKTSIQATQRKHPDHTPKAGKQRRREFEYTRHGTASLHAALDVHSGGVLAQEIPSRNDSVNFCGFLNEIEHSVDPTLNIHIIMDNGSAHTSKHTKAWFGEHPRWVVHYTPPHASWVNQIELFFSILQRKVIRNGSFTSRQDLIDKLLAFITTYDQTATPFKWTYAADPLVA